MSMQIAGANNTGNLSTLTMVFILVGVVKGVFICFAVVAVCYRYSVKSERFPLDGVVCIFYGIVMEIGV